MDGPDQVDDLKHTRSNEEGGEKHPHFDLWLHSTDSLEESLGQPILSRETIHDWPLSCVQRIECPDRTLIYKTQVAPTVEPDFYVAASSKLLPAHQYLGKVNGCHTMMFEYIAETTLAHQPFETRDLLALGARLQDEIDKIEGELPVYTDIGSEDRWLSYVDGSLHTPPGSFMTPSSHASLRIQSRVFGTGPNHPAS